MNIDFSLVLVVLSAISGVIWLGDIFLLRKPRKARTSEYLFQQKSNFSDFEAYLDTLDENGQPVIQKEGSEPVKSDPARLAVFRKAIALYRDPVPVEYAKSFFPILFAVLLLRSFLFEPFQIPTGSMIPTLNVGDFIVVNKFAYGLRLPVLGTKVVPIGEPKRGDIMVFIPPHDPNYFIKRVIGLPGDHVQYKDKTVFINGSPLPQEPVGIIREQGVLHSMETVNGVTHDIYTSASDRFPRYYDWLEPEGMVIPEGHYFMMGDNRDNSSDSRYWGTVPEANIVGKAVAVWMHKEPGVFLPGFSENRLIVNPE